MNITSIAIWTSYDCGIQPYGSCQTSYCFQF